jgi:GH25 family lysozyme M1 (1,4-beta-N-acetylmuramidase)
VTIFGWDLSHYDSPDSTLAVSEGFKFLTHKAGGDANDAELGSWWSYMKPYRDRALLGAYWVLYPGNPSGRADAFISRLDSQCPGWRDAPFILQVDCEKWNNDPDTVPSKNEIEAFCDRLVYRMPKLRPIVYAPKWVYGDSLKGLSYPLWASSYVSGSGVASVLYPGDSSSRWGAYSGQVPAILQFTSSATIAGQTTCDANAYRGTLAQLTALVAPGWTPKEIDVAITPEDASTIASATWNAGFGPSSARETAGERLAYIDATVPNLATAAQVNTLGASLLAAIAALDDVDEQALAQFLAPLLLAGMPAGTLTQADVENALRNVLVHGTEGN